jgi:hypothetical protein
MCSQAVIRRDCLRISGSNLSPSSPPSNLGKGGRAGGGGGEGGGKPSVDGGSGIIADSITYFGKTLNAVSLSGSSEVEVGGEGGGGLWWRRMRRLLPSSSAPPLSRECAQPPSPLPVSESLSTVATHQAIPSGVCVRARGGSCVCVLCV